MTTENTALGRALAYVETLVFDELQPGERLPSEGELAGRLGVSRLTMREAMKQLSARGIVETHNGRLPIAMTPTGRGVGDYFRSTVRRDPRALLDLMEVRLALETHIARLAAANARPASLAVLSDAIDDMAEHLTDSAGFIEADSKFHALLAMASGNQMLATLLEELSSSIHESQVHSVAAHLKRGLSLDDALAQHADILDRVRARDASGAAAAMRKHLRNTRKDLTSALLGGPVQRIVGDQAI